MHEKNSVSNSGVWCHQDKKDAKDKKKGIPSPRAKGKDDKKGLCFSVCCHQFYA